MRLSKGFKSRWVSGFGKDSKVIRELTQKEIEERQDCEWYSPEELLQKLAKDKNFNASDEKN